VRLASYDERMLTAARQELQFGLAPVNLDDAVYIFSGFGVGVLVGLTGVGGGSLMTPLLVLLFGIHPSAAVGTDLLFAASTKTLGTLVHGAARNIDWRLVGLLAAGSVPATIVSLIILSAADLDSAIARRMMTVALGVVLLLTSAVLFFSERIPARYADRIARFDQKVVRVFTIVLGAAMGILVTVTSVGAGAIAVTVLLFLHPKMPISRLIGSDIAHAVPLTFVAGAGHWYLGSVDWKLLGPLLIGSLPGIVAGSLLVGRIPIGAVRTVLAFVLFVVAIRLVT
jgi:uncharacterized protein